MDTMDFSVASPIETIGFRTKSSVFGNIQVVLVKGADGVNYDVSVTDHTLVFTPIPVGGGA